MKLSCEFVRDLLPLYDSAVCTEETRKAIEEHLAECEKCRKARATAIAPMPAAGKKSAKAKQKPGKKWLAPVLIVLAFLLIVTAGVLGYNEIAGTGRGFTNWDEVKAGKDFLTLIAEEKYEEASEHIDFDVAYMSITQEDYIAQLGKISNNGIEITKVRFYSIRRMNGDWITSYLLDFKADGKTSRIGLDFVADGDQLILLSYPKHDDENADFLIKAITTVDSTKNDT